VSPPVAPLVQELKNPDDGQTRILVFIVIADGKAHTFRNGEKTAYYIRIGRETREARNGFLTQLLASKHEIVPFDRRPNPNTGETDIDLLLFRDCMNEMKLNQPAKPLENYLSSTEQIAEFIPPLLAKKNLDDAYCLRNFTLLLFGKKNSITVNFPEAYTVISIYNGTDRSEPTAVRHTLTGSIIVQAKQSLELLKSQIYTVFDKTSATPNQEKYPARALQEALVNAVVHRDYEMPDPVRVTVFSDRIEILSPGCLHFGVDKDKFLAGKAAPNFRAMKEEGCPAPVFELGVDSVTCVLPAHPRSQA
jgi:predicted HTH transcriptional regulator